MFEVSLSHVLPNGTKKYKAETLEIAKQQGDAIFSNVKLPSGGRHASSQFRILVTDNGDVVAARDLPDGEWKAARSGYQEFPKMLADGVIVHSREEEEAALAPAEAPARRRAR